MTVKTRITDNPVLSIAIALASLLIVGFVCFRLVLPSEDQKPEEPNTASRPTNVTQRPLQMPRHQVTNLATRPHPKNDIRDASVPQGHFAEQAPVPTVETSPEESVSYPDSDREAATYNAKYDTLLDIYRQIDELGQQLGAIRRRRASVLNPILSGIDGRTHVTQEEADEVMVELTAQRPMLDRVKTNEANLWRQYKALFKSIEELIPGSVMRTSADGLDIPMPNGGKTISTSEIAVDYAYIKLVLGSPPPEVDERLAEFFGTAGISSMTSTATLSIGGDTSESERRQ